MSLHSLIEKKRNEFISLCREHSVKKMYAFGSSITDWFDERRSDIDVLVDVDIDDPVKKGQTLLALWDSLEVFFNRSVDLLTEASIRNPYLRANVERTRKLIYHREGEKVSI